MLETTWAVLYEPGDVAEVRVILKSGGKAKHWNGWSSGIVSGYFDNGEDLAAWVNPLDASGLAEGIYITLNPVLPELLARAANRLVGLKRNDPTTTDEQIAIRRWVLIDVDPVRPKGISSNAEELQRAASRAKAVRSYMAVNGWPQPVTACSGNGIHLLYRVDMPPSYTDMLKIFLADLADQFSDNVVDIDRKVFNPSRITKLYGTVARKGDPTDDRPHRRSSLLDISLDITP
jgi:hypothetical protein